MIGGSLARRYARALLDIGVEDGQVRRVLSEVEAFEALLAQTPLLREALEASHVNRPDKHAALEAATSGAGFLPATRNFLMLLVDKGRTEVLPPIVAELRRLVERREGIERVEVVVPAALTDAQRDRLRETLAARTGKTVTLEERVDPAVLGGMVVKIGDTVYDGSVRTQIRQIREILEKG